MIRLETLKTIIIILLFVLSGGLIVTKKDPVTFTVHTENQGMAATREELIENVAALASVAKGIAPGATVTLLSLKAALITEKENQLAEFAAAFSQDELVRLQEQLRQLESQSHASSKQEPTL